ncbi:hypothetical protein EB796_001959 [Bugula neritina]|uniref:Uncharacterized protein n=1 Tax=Bugula neritina TaxID=10212 RepID=A0A7J7KNK2_BUGNE|nr:hypothetical protein EB796_001959 [Bugula neritina]
MAYTQNLQHNYYVNTRESKESTIHPRKKVEGPHTDASCSYKSKTVDDPWGGQAYYLVRRCGDTCGRYIDGAQERHYSEDCNYVGYVDNRTGHKYFVSNCHCQTSDFV